MQVVERNLLGKPPYIGFPERDWMCKYFKIIYLILDLLIFACAFKKEVAALCVNAHLIIRMR